MFKNKFKVCFKGVRGSYPVPDKKFLNYGGNTSCVYVVADNHRIILDAGSGIVEAGKQILEERIVSQDKSPLILTVLLSHLHLDHIQGLPFLSQLHSAGVKINLFAPANSNQELEKDLSDLLFGKSFPLSINEIKSDLTINAINDKNNDFAILLKEGRQEPIITKISELNNVDDNDVVITTLYSKTHPKEGVMIYKIKYKGKSIVYATDKESYTGGDKLLSNFARETDLLIHDSQYTEIDYNSIINSKQGYGHSSIEMALLEKENAHAKNLAFFHYDPTYDDNKLDEIKKDIINKSEGLIMPYENLEIEIL